ncbi:MAG: TetR/AcrR family transcriptional regulator, partial [Lachnospiraceae bacterium]|nr:TetR/AcrR family transcriptional regulator [Lachnospiraceae bacterium]
RRNEILDVAERLFCSRGYDQTSTNDILAEIGIARGTLYYHFSSKEDILDAMIDRILNEIVRRASQIALDGSIPVLERMTQTILASNVDTKTGDMILEQMHKPQNALMHAKMQERLLKQLIPLFTKLIEDGISQGLMQTDDPEDTIEMLLLYANTVFDDAIAYSEKEKKKKVLAFISNTELLLHMEKGSLLEAMLPMFYRE